MSDDAKRVTAICSKAKSLGISVKHVNANGGLPLLKDNILYVVYESGTVRLVFCGKIMTKFDNPNIDLFLKGRETDCQVCLTNIGENYAPACSVCFGSVCMNCSVKVSTVAITDDEVYMLYKCPFCRDESRFFTFCDIISPLTEFEKLSITYKFEIFKRTAVSHPAFFKHYLKDTAHKLDFTLLNKSFE